MAGGEFDLIARYFSPAAPEGFLGVGDDCAIFPVRPGRQWVSSTDMLLQGRHFLSSTDPYALGHKALAVNVSDLAAMGARPEACLLALALPVIDDAWLQAFSAGFLAYAQATGCALVGGDTTRSVSGLQICVTVMGSVPVGLALRRDAARPNDDIWLTGHLGGPHLAWQLAAGQWSQHLGLLASVQGDLHQPDPPWQFAQALPGVAHAALDISDGLIQDLSHILSASQVGARLEYAVLPGHAALAGLPDSLCQEALLQGGEVYQLCFTAAPRQRARVQQLGQQYGIRLTRIGQVVVQPGLVVQGVDARPMDLDALRGGYDHFS